MAVRTATKAGVLSDSTVFGATFNDGDQLDTGAFAVTIDVSKIIGDSRPSRPTTVPTVNVTGGGAGGGSLAAGTYRLTYCNVDSGGKLSAVSPACSTFTVSAGNIPRVTLPSLPTGVSSRNIYLTNTNAPTGGRALYATGNTTTTIDLTSASWQDGTQTFAGATAEHNGYAVSIGNSGSLTVNPGVSVTCRGGVSQGNGPLTVDLSGADVTWEFDASQAASPSNTNYGWWEGAANTQTNCKMLTTGTTGRWKLRSNSGGGNGFFARGIDVGANGSFSDTTFWSVENVDFLRIGDATRDKIVFGGNASTFTFKLKNCTSDACGSEFFSGNLASASSLTYDGNKFTNGAYRTILSTPTPVRFAVSATATGTRLVTNCSFDLKPVLRGGAISYTNCYFHKGWDHAGDATNWTSMDGCLIRLVDSATQGTNGPVTNYICFFDPPQTQQTTGTATAGGANTLTDGGKTFTVNQYASAPGANTFQLHVTGGTGSGQRRRISSNTATVVTVKPNWITQPDATSTYEIILDGNNFHGFNGSPNAVDQAFTGGIFGANSVDSDGDGIKQFSVAANFDVSGNIVLPNASGVDMTCCLITMFSNTNSGARVTCNHNTICIGLQSAFQIDEGGHVQPAGTFAAAKSNIIWSPRAVSEYPAGLAGMIVTDDGDNPSGATTDILAPANATNNFGQNLLNTGIGGGAYNYRTSTTPGTNDLSGNPQFVDSTRNLDTWSASLGGASTYAAGLARLQADPTQIATAYAWIKAGFAPQNAALHGTAHDGTDIGAGSYVAPATTDPGKTLLLLGA